MAIKTCLYFRRLCMAALLGWICLQGEPSLARKARAQGQIVAVERRVSSENAFIVWARENAAPVALQDPAITGAEARAVKAIVGNSRVVALGEAAHGVHEPLAFRNRLFRFLVEECGYTAISLETGFTEARLLNDYVLGGAEDPRDVLQRGFTWGFGRARENLELLRWIRNHNAVSERKVRVYGIDISGGSDAGEIENARSTLDGPLALMTRSGVELPRETRRSLEQFLPRFSQKGYSSFSAEERAQFRSLLRALAHAFEGGRQAIVAASSPDDYDFERRNLVVAEKIEQMFAVLPPDPPGGGLSPEFYKPSSVRDAAMAANVIWALQKEGPRGKMMVFAHNAHIVNASLRSGLWSVYRKPAVMMGQHLRKDLGSALRIIATSSATNDADLGERNRTAGRVDMALRAADPNNFILSLRLAKPASDVRKWLGASQTLRANLNTEIAFVPSSAIDAIVHFSALSRSRPMPR